MTRYRFRYMYEATNVACSESERVRVRLDDSDAEMPFESFDSSSNTMAGSQTCFCVVIGTGAICSIFARPYMYVYIDLFSTREIRQGRIYSLVVVLCYQNLYRIVSPACKGIRIMQQS